MQRNQLAIGLLSLSALALLVLNWILPTGAGAQVAIRDRDLQVVTATIQTGGDALYILDNRTSQIAVFTYDPSTRGIVARQVRNVADGFAAR